jgi:hypothetical protein
MIRYDGIFFSYLTSFSSFPCSVCAFLVSFLSNVFLRGIPGV